MHIQESQQPLQQTLGEGRPLYRAHIFTGLGILFGVSSLLIVFFTIFFSVSTLMTPPPLTKPLAVVSTPRPTATPTPIPTPSPTPIPTPSPIVPFPTDLQQQKAVLTAHDRFLYQGNSQIPEVALTFDDGPGPIYTPQVLAVLQHYHIHATFFCVGSQVQTYPNLVKLEFQGGNLVGNHSWSHPNMPLLSNASLIWQITTSENIIQQTIGVHTNYFRPPYGAVSSNTLTNLNTFGMTTILWNSDPRDWSLPGVNSIVNTVMNQTSNGTIILLHDGGGDRSETVAALPTIIEQLQARGLRFVTIDQMVKDLHKAK